MVHIVNNWLQPLCLNKPKRKEKNYLVPGQNTNCRLQWSFVAELSSCKLHLILLDFTANRVSALKYHVLMVNERKRHISSPVIPWPVSKTSSEAKAAHMARPGALCSEENTLLVCCIVSSGAMTIIALLACLQGATILSHWAASVEYSTWSHVLLWGLRLVKGIS